MARLNTRVFLNFPPSAAAPLFPDTNVFGTFFVLFTGNCYKNGLYLYFKRVQRVWQGNTLTDLRKKCQRFFGRSE